MVGRGRKRDAGRDAAAIFCLRENLVSEFYYAPFPPNFFCTLSLSPSLSVSISTHSVWSWLIISTGISCVAHQGWKHFNLRGKTNSRGWQISMSRWQLLPVISFNYHIISFYRRGAGCRAANEGARSHAELRAFLNCCQQLTGVRVCVMGRFEGSWARLKSSYLQVISISDTDRFILNELPTDNGHCLVGNGRCA